MLRFSTDCASGHFIQPINSNSTAVSGGGAQLKGKAPPPRISKGVARLQRHACCEQLPCAAHLHLLQYSVPPYSPTQLQLRLTLLISVQVTAHCVQGITWGFPTPCNLFTGLQDVALRGRKLERFHHFCLNPEPVGGGGGAVEVLLPSFTLLWFTLLPVENKPCSWVEWKEEKGCFIWSGMMLSFSLAVVANAMGNWGYRT